MKSAAHDKDYLNFVASEGLEPVKERHARTMAWWCANDATRDQTGDYSDFALSETQRQNLFRLSELLDPEIDDDSVTKAEIARSLGNFYVGLDLLSEPVRDDLTNKAETVASLCRQRTSAVAEIPGEPW
jgi:hypothetical protein